MRRFAEQAAGCFRFKSQAEAGKASPTPWQVDVDPGIVLPTPRKGYECFIDVLNRRVRIVDVSDRPDAGATALTKLPDGRYFKVIGTENTLGEKLSLYLDMLVAVNGLN